MGRDVVVTVQLPEASPDAYIRLTRACREAARQILRDPLLEDLSATVAWQLVDQASRARLEGRPTIAPTLELEPDHVELAREYARQGRPEIPAARSTDPDVQELLHRCSQTVEDTFSAGRRRVRVALGR